MISPGSGIKWASERPGGILKYSVDSVNLLPSISYQLEVTEQRQLIRRVEAAKTM
jgi:hypothetical protein